MELFCYETDEFNFVLKMANKTLKHIDLFDNIRNIGLSSSETIFLEKCERDTKKNECLSNRFFSPFLEITKFLLFFQNYLRIWMKTEKC